MHLRVNIVINTDSLIEVLYFFLFCFIFILSYSISHFGCNPQRSLIKIFLPLQVDLTNFQDYNYEWKLVKVVSNRESKLYPCCPDEYPLVNFNITMKRRNYYQYPVNGNWLFFSFKLMLPTNFLKRVCNGSVSIDPYKQNLYVISSDLVNNQMKIIQTKGSPQVILKLLLLFFNP